MNGKLDYFLLIFITSLNFFMLGIQESCLFTVLPKLFSNSSVTSSSLTPNCSSVASLSSLVQNCSSRNQQQQQSPPYMIISIIFLVKNIAMNITNPLIGIFSGSINDFVMMMFSYFNAIVVLIIYAINPVAVNFLIGRSIDAISAACIFVSTFGLISRLHRSSNTRSKLFGIGNIVFFISMSVGPVFGAEVQTALGGSVVFLLLIPGWLLCMTVSLGFMQRQQKKGLQSQQQARSLRNPKMLPDDAATAAEDDDNAEMMEENVVVVLAQPNTQDKLPLAHRKNSIIRLFRILKDPYVLCCVLDVLVIDLGQYALPPTLPTWMRYELRSTEAQQGLVWLFVFVGYGLGVFIVVISGRFSQKLKLYLAVAAKALMGGLILWIPHIRNDWRWLFVPVLGIFMCVGVAEQVVFPLMTQLADLRHQSDYRLMNSILSQSLTICAVIGSVASGPIAQHLGFPILCIIVGSVTVIFSPITLVHLLYNRS